MGDGNGALVSRTLGAHTGVVRVRPRVRLLVRPPDTSIIGDRPIFFPRLLLSTYQEKRSTYKHAGTVYIQGDHTG